MRYSWEEDDIIPGRVVKQNPGEHAMIGYDALEETGHNYRLILLMDGSIATKPLTKAQVAYWLTKTNCAPIDREKFMNVET